MKAALCSYVAGFAVASPDTGSPSVNRDEMETQFEQFVHKYNKIYRDAEERRSRFNTFKQNIVDIETKNARETGLYGQHVYGVNSLSDLNAVEFKQNYLGLSIPPAMHNLSTFVPASTSLVPSSIDWVSKGAVTPIKNQGQCGSCWTFSTTGAIEGAWQIAHGKLVSLSEQQVVDCAHNAGQGCGGGWPSAAIKWEESQGICGESEYKYTGRNGQCHGCNGSPVLPRGSVTGAQAVAASADSMRAALAEKPVSVCVDAETWQHYHGGIFSNCGTSLDHAVLAVGYDSSSWKVKNSWGTWWGDKGYIHLRMGNTCGVLNNAVVALVSGSPTPPTPPGPSPPTPPSPSPSPCHTCTWNSDCPSGQECYYPSSSASSGCCYSSPPSASGLTDEIATVSDRDPYGNIVDDIMKMVCALMKNGDNEVAAENLICGHMDPLLVDLCKSLVKFDWNMYSKLAKCDAEGHREVTGILDNILKLVCALMKDGGSSEAVAEKLICEHLKYNLEVAACDKVVDTLWKGFQNKECPAGINMSSVVV